MSDSSSPDVLCAERIEAVIYIRVTAEFVPMAGVKAEANVRRLEGLQHRNHLRRAIFLGMVPKNIRAAIGPNIGFCCFETDGEVPQAMRESFGEEAEEFICFDGTKYRLDLKGINALALKRAGVSRIEISTECTMCQHDRFWSHRYTHGERGSQGAIIVCPEI